MPIFRKRKSPASQRGFETYGCFGITGTDGTFEGAVEGAVDGTAGAGTVRSMTVRSSTVVLLRGKTIHNPPNKTESTMRIGISIEVELSTSRRGTPDVVYSRSSMANLCELIVPSTLRSVTVPSLWLLRRHWRRRSRGITLSAGGRTGDRLFYYRKQK